MKRFKLLVILMMLALVPLRGLAATTTGMCAVGTQEPVHHGHLHHSEGSSVQAEGDESSPGPTADCGTCLEHCASALVVVAFPSSSVPAAASSQRPGCPQSFALGFVPDHLDPPPLAFFS